jgi:hypothetical protein
MGRLWKATSRELLVSGTMPFGYGEPRNLVFHDIRTFVAVFDVMKVRMAMKWTAWRLPLSTFCRAA